MTPIKVTAELLRTMRLPQPKAGSKDGRGSVLVIAGSVEVPGAALLASTAVLRAGAGRLQIATVQSCAIPLALAVPEAMVLGLAETATGGIDHAARTSLLEKTKTCDAVLIGAGMTEDASTAHLTSALLTGSPTSMVLDAAAVCDLSADAAAIRSRQGCTIITPHAGEMAQVLDKSRDEIEADPLDAALSAATLLNATVVMKGANTYIVEPGGTVWLYEGGCVGLATSGSGDALSGIIAGLLARGASAAQAAIWGVFLHGEAGSRLAQACGPLGFLAREISSEVPRLMHEIDRASP